MVETRYNLKFTQKKYFIYFKKWADKNNLKWVCGEIIKLKDWKIIKNKISLFWLIDGQYVDFETCASTTFNCKNVRYRLLNEEDFIDM